MKSVIILTSIFMLAVISDYSQVTQQWVRTYNGTYNDNDVPSYIAVDGSGNVYVTGISYGFQGANYIVTIKYGTGGVQQWIATYGQFGYDEPTGIAVDNSGNVYIAAFHYVSNGISRFETIKYNSSGVQQWIAEYAGPVAGGAGPSAILIDGSAIYVAGESQPNSYDYGDYTLIKYNTNGVQQWVQSYVNIMGEDAPYAMAIDNNGNIYLTGAGSEANHPEYEYLTVKFSPSGVLQWHTFYTGLSNGNGWDYANSIAVDGSGNSYVTGGSRGTDGFQHCATIKYNTSGAQQWVQRYNSGGLNGDDIGNKIFFKDGFIYVAGVSQGIGTGKDYLTIKYNPSGNQVWLVTYDGPSDGRDEGNDIIVDDYGDVYVTGMSKGNDGTTHMATVRYNSNGTQQWVQRYNSGQCSGYVDEGSVGIAIGPSGNIYVTGYTTHIDQNCSYYDYCTIKYTQEGIGINPVSNNIPEKYSLEQNYPNPFNPATKIKFALPNNSFTKLVIYDATGREVETLVNEQLTAGTYEAEWSAVNFSSGVYYYKLSMGDYVDTKKMVLVK